MHIRQQSPSSTIHAVMMNANHVGSYCVKLFSFQTGNFTASHLDNRGNIRWFFQDFSDIREVFTNFWVVTILDRPSFTAAPYGHIASTKLLLTNLFRINLALVFPIMERHCSKSWIFRWVSNFPPTQWRGYFIRYQNDQSSSCGPFSQIILKSQWCTYW